MPNVAHAYRFAPTIPRNTLSYDGRWRVGAERIVAGANARLRLRFEAKNVYIVLGGHGNVQALIDGKPAGTIHVDAQRLYTVRSSQTSKSALLELRFTPGVQAYSFTFG